MSALACISDDLTDIYCNYHGTHSDEVLISRSLQKSHFIFHIWSTEHFHNLFIITGSFYLYLPCYFWRNSPEIPPLLNRYLIKLGPTPPIPATDGGTNKSSNPAHFIPKRNHLSRRSPSQSPNWVVPSICKGQLRRSVRLQRQISPWLLFHSSICWRVGLTCLFEVGWRRRTDFWGFGSLWLEG